MKNKLLFVFLFLGILGYGQVPSYYNDVNLNLSGQQLLDELSDKVTTTHTTFLSYTPGVWDALKQTDLDPTDSGKVLLLYGFNDTDGDSTTDRTRGVNNNGGGTTDWNREHTYPKSLGNPNLGTSGPGADAHHLRPADVQRNSSRGSRKFADGLGNSGVTPQGYWYPGDEWKGDVARMMMYMYVRYGSVCLPVNVGMGNTVSSDPNMIDLFLQWNVEDPVSDFELQRNPILEGIQGNRNPFIDNPAFATQIWGGPQAEDRFGNIGGGDVEAPTIPAGLVALNITSDAINLSWNASSDNVGVTGYDIFQNSIFLASTGTTNYAITGLNASTSYNFMVRAKDDAGNISGLSNALVVTTSGSSGSGSISELIISEYVEGSSYNKAIEIANFTGASVDLSQYNLRRQANGSGSWEAALYLSGTLANADVVVIVNSSASFELTNKADFVTSSSALSFNGNDPVGLFKGNTLIDIIGNFNGGSGYFAQDQTVRRKSNVADPSINYITSEWEFYPQNTFNDLGLHTVNGGGSVDTTPPTAPSNLIASNITQNSLTISWSPSSDNVGVASYDIYQNGNFSFSTSATTFTSTGLSAGTMYNYRIIAYDEANNASTEATITVTTLNPALSYCNTRGNNTNYEFIDYVSIGEIFNVTGGSSGYADYSNQVANIDYGTNTILFSAGFSSSSYTENWAAWIDFNQNGTFESTELILSGSSSSSSNLFADFTVPASAISGTTRLRISMKWNGTPSPCETFGYGEVEDYTVNIGSSNIKQFISSQDQPVRLGHEPAIYTLNITPNPAKNRIELNIKDDRVISVNIMDINGRMVMSFDSAKRSIDVSGLRSGMYILSAFDGNRKLYQKLIIE